jgi:hypothetical protein
MSDIRHQWMTGIGSDHAHLPYGATSGVGQKLTGQPIGPLSALHSGADIAGRGREVALGQEPKLELLATDYWVP